MDNNTSNDMLRTLHIIQYAFKLQYVRISYTQLWLTIVSNAKFKIYLWPGVPYAFAHFLWCRWCCCWMMMLLLLSCSVYSPYSSCFIHVLYIYCALCDSGHTNAIQNAREHKSTFKNI